MTILSCLTIWFAVSLLCTLGWVLIARKDL